MQNNFKKFLGTENGRKWAHENGVTDAHKMMSIIIAGNSLNILILGMA